MRPASGAGQPIVRTAIIILTYNGRQLIDACLAAVRANTDLAPTRVVVVDNASRDGTADHVAAAHPWVHLVRNGENLGFAGGVNTGIQAVDAEGYVLLNTDALVPPGWLDHLWRTADEARAGIVAAYEVNEDGSPRWGPPRGPVASRPPEEHDRVSFACVLIRRDVVRRIGFLDHGYFMYHEDWDYCHRAKAAGFRIVLDPAVEVVHPGAKSFDAQVPAWKARIRTASRMRYQATHWTTARRIQSAFREPLVAGYWAKQGLLKPYLQGLRDGWRTRKDARRRRQHPVGFLPAQGQDRPLHVAMALPWPSWAKAGGTERHVHELSSALLRLGVEVTVLVPAGEGAPPGLAYAVRPLASARLRRLQALRKVLPRGRTLLARAWDREFNRLAQRAARTVGADLLHRHFTYEVGFRPSLPLVLTLHNGHVPEDEAPARAGALVRRDLDRRTAGLRQAVLAPDAVVCVSEHVRDSVLGRVGARRDVHVVPNGCPPSPAKEPKADIRSRLGLGSERVVLYVGHLWHHKRVPRLLPLAQEQAVRLVFIGSGDLQPELRAVAARQPNVTVLGHVDEPTKHLWMRAADVVALPSGPFEGQGIVLLEALRAGTPVYGTTATWLPGSLRPFGRFGEDVRLALEAARIDATPAIALVPDWDAVARDTLEVYRGAVAAFRAKR